MSVRSRAVLITAGIGVVTFGAGPLLFSPPDDAPEPTGTQLGLLIGVQAVEALALGLGVAFLVLGWPLVNRIVGPSRPRAVVTHLSAGWLLANWWLHDNLHMANGSDLDGIIAIDYVFHTTLIAAGLVVSWTLLDGLRSTITASPRLAEPVSR